ncbi:hypothetical protein F5H01DRAFT_337861 [Linnemannia elongata]|nr:hypothetical protein F5H01DRAFT_337861 [Linnemannia elongata]
MRLSSVPPSHFHFTWPSLLCIIFQKWLWIISTSSMPHKKKVLIGGQVPVRMLKILLFSSSHCDLPERVLSLGAGTDRIWFLGIYPSLLSLSPSIILIDSESPFPSET